MPRGRKANVVPKTIGARLTLEYIERAQMPQARLAQICEMGRNTLNECLNGKRVPLLADAFKLQDVTEGEVPARSWLLAVDAKPPRTTARKGTKKPSS